MADDISVAVGLADNIKALRASRRMPNGKSMTQADLGHELGVTAQAVSSWERGDSSPDMPHLMAMADFFGLTLDQMQARRLPLPATTQLTREGALVSAELSLTALEAAIRILRPDKSEQDAKALAAIFLSLALMPPDSENPAPFGDQLRSRFQGAHAAQSVEK